MIVIITTNEINLNEHVPLKNIERLKSVGELDLIIGNSIILKDEIIHFKIKESKIELLVGLNWIKNNYDISLIIFFDYVTPINNDLLGNHIIIPKKIFSIDDPPLEWNSNPLVKKIEINIKKNNTIRKAIHETNYDFYYGDILSIDKKFINTSSIKELSDLNYFDGINYFIFNSNKFANENKIDIYNICIAKTKYMLKLKFEKIFEKLF